nr:unnamed protein product [Haemonchus contortus]
MWMDRRYPEAGDVGCGDLAVTVVVGAAAVSTGVGDVTVVVFSEGSNGTSKALLNSGTAPGETRGIS